MSIVSPAFDENAKDVTIPKTTLYAQIICKIAKFIYS